MEVEGRKKREEGTNQKVGPFWTLLSNVSPRFVADLYPRNTHIAQKTCNVHTWMARHPIQSGRSARALRRLDPQLLAPRPPGSLSPFPLNSCPFLRAKQTTRRGILSTHDCKFKKKRQFYSLLEWEKKDNKIQRMTSARETISYESMKSKKEIERHRSPPRPNYRALASQESTKCKAHI